MHHPAEDPKAPPPADHDVRRRGRVEGAPWAAAALTLLLVAMLVTSEVDWRVANVVFARALVLGADLLWSWT